MSSFECIHEQKAGNTGTFDDLEHPFGFIEDSGDYIVILGK